MSADGKTEPDGYDVEIPSPPPEGDDDALARKEEAAFEKGEPLDEQRKWLDFWRDQSLRDALQVAIIFFVIVASVLLLAGLMVWGWHLLSPTSWHWLSEPQFEILIFSGAISSLVTAVGGKLLRR